MKPTILIATHVSEFLLSRLAARYVVHGPIEHPEAGLPEATRNVRVLVTLGGLRTDAALMDALPELKLIACYGTGFEGVDRAAARARGIIVTHARDTNSVSVAEFAMGLILASTRKIVRGDQAVRGGLWRTALIETLSLTPELAGQRLGIYGLGSIGSKIAQRAAAFDMQIGYHNRSPRQEVGYLYHPTLLGLAIWSDILVVSVRAGPANYHAINKEILQALGPDGHLINVSRGIVVDEAALCDALETGAIAGAGLDVYEDEPNVPARLSRLDNVVLTPHIAAVSLTAQSAQCELLLANLEAFFAGRPVLTPVPE
jgi:lactate dehydrogenase-like 2-hydroxyacid dehydrogenase